MNIKKVVSFLGLIAILNLNFACTRPYIVSPSQAPTQGFKDQVDVYLFNGSNIRLYNVNFTPNSVYGHTYPAIFRSGAQDELSRTASAPAVDVSRDYREIPKSEIEMLMIEKTDAGRTGLGVMVFLGSVVLAGIVGWFVFLSFASCPYIYSFDGHDYQLDAEPLAGSITKSLERTDYIRLEHLQPFNGFYQIRQSNELKEIHYTDQVSLLIANHPAGSILIPDSEGKLFALQSPAPPRQAILADGTDITPLVAAADNRTWQKDFDFLQASTSDQPLVDEISLEFPRPPGADNLYLWVRGRNTPLSSFLLWQYLKRYNFGYAQALNVLSSLVNVKDRYENRMLREGAHIQVRLEKNGSYETVGKLREVGPAVIGNRLAVIPLGPPTGDTVRLKLVLGRSLWEVDSIQASFALAEPVQVQEISPISISGGNQAEILPKLLSEDGNYWVAKEGDQIELQFPAPAQLPGTDRSVVLKIHGYYQPIFPKAKGDEPYNKVEPYRGEPLTHFGARLIKSLPTE